MIRQLRAAMRLPDGMRFHGLALTATEDAIVAMLLQAGGACTAGQVNSWVEHALNRENGVQENTCAVYVCRIREKFGALDPPVRISSKQRSGYWMEPTDKARLMERRVKTTDSHIPSVTKMTIKV